MFEFLKRTAFNLVYLFHPPWDTGIPAPEIVRFIAGKAPPQKNAPQKYAGQAGHSKKTECRQAGKALDLGCGTGTNLLYLAQHGWTVTGIDQAPLAIYKARRKLRGVTKTLLVADVTKLAGLELPGPYDLGVDMGCFHTLAETGRSKYVKGVERWIKAGGILMIYAFQPVETSPTQGITREEMTAYFQDGFELINYEQGQGRPSAWYYFKRL
jgi:SAM-dependent methyltransferase